MKAIIPATDLIAAQMFVSKDTSRPILTGIHIEVKDGKATIAATDSYRLVVIESENEWNEDGEVTIDMSGLKPKKKDIYTIEFDDEDVQSLEATMTNLDRVKVTSRAIEGNYPNYKQLIPERNETAIPTTSIGLNPTYINELGKAYRAWKGDNKAPLNLEFRGSMKPAMMFDFDGNRSFIGLIMPVRFDSYHLAQPVVGNENTAVLESELKDVKSQLKRAEERIIELQANQPNDDKAINERLDKANKVIEELTAQVKELQADPIKQHLKEHIVVVDATPEHNEVQSKVDALISEFELIEIAGSTSCAIYFKPTIKKDSDEMVAIKAAGGRYGNHKKYGKCWYMPTR